MNNITVSAKNYDEAITKALIQLGTTSEHLTVEVVEKGSNGLFGVFGGKPWVIRAHVKSEEEEAAERKAAADAAREEAERQAKQEPQREETVKEKATEKISVTVPVEPTAANEKTEVLRKKAQEIKNPVEKQPSFPEKKGRKRYEKRESFRKHPESRGENPRSRYSAENRREISTGREVLPEEAADIKAVAENFLSEVFRIMEEKIEIDTDFNFQSNELGISLSGADMGVLIGKRGQTLDSLQYLVSLVVNKHRDVYIRVKLDTENYRERREQKLRSLAKNIARKVKQTRRPVSLEPMNPYERRIIHSALQRDPYVTTCSEGEDPYRHVVVVLKREQKRQSYGEQE